MAPSIACIAGEEIHRQWEAGNITGERLGPRQTPFGPSGEVFLVAGPPDECDADDPAAALEGRRGAILMAVNPNDGKKLFEFKLDAAPVFDGMSAAAGRLYLSAADGQVTCLAAAE